MFQLLIFMSIMSFTPGPNNLLVMHLSIHSGFKNASRYILGSFSGIFIVAAICGFGNLVVSAYLPLITNVVKYIGFSFILYMAYKVLKSSHPIEGEMAPTAGMIHGFLFQFANPKLWLSSITVFSVYVFEFSSSLYAVPLTALFMSLLGITAQFLWALFGLALKQYYNQYYKAVNTVMALSLVYLAISILH